MFATRLAVPVVVWFAVAFCAPSVPAKSLKVGASDGSRGKYLPMSVPMKVLRCGGNKECYRVDIAVGTPPRTFRVTLDNAALYQSVYLFSSKMPPPNSTCKPVDIHRNLFDPSLSRTFVLDHESQVEGGGRPPYYPYEDPTCTTDPFRFSASGFNDSMRIGYASVPSVPANLITVIDAPLSPEWDADGFLSVHTPKSSNQSAYDMMGVFLSTFERPLMTFYYASFSVNGKSFLSGEYNNIILTTSFITAPQTAIDAVVKATGAEYDFDTDTYQVDCDKRSSFPDMVFWLTDTEYRLPAIDYARKLNASDKRCTLMLVPGDFATFWELGTTFFRPYCTLLDYNAATLSVAKVVR